MVHRWFFASSAAVLLLSSTAVGAVSVTNRDDRDHKITIIEGETKVEHVLKATEVKEGLCPKGCVLRLNDNDDEEYELDAKDVVTIEDGYLYYEDDAAPGGGKEPPKK